MGMVSVHYRRSDVMEKVQEVEHVVQRNTHRPFAYHLYRHHKLYTTALMATAGLMFPLIASASVEAPSMGGGKSIILLLQQASFWVGMGITIWGIVEAQLDFPGWRGRITKGILGYIGILLVPLIFIELQNSLQVDVWTKIDEGMK